MKNEQKNGLLNSYRFSFVGADAMIHEFIKLGKLVFNGTAVEELDASFLGIEKKQTYIRKFRELKLRIKNLTGEQLEILANGNHDQQLQITQIALCKTYRIYREFVSEVLAEKIQVFDYTITDLDYNMFISRKKIDHPELEDLTANTQKRVKQVIYKMLKQVELIDSTKSATLQIPMIDSKVELVVLQDDPKLLKCFLYDDNRIQKLV